ncbi:MAG: regulatory protein RecX [Ekhidna sp.]
MPRQLEFKEAKQRAGRFCAFRERSPNELLEKLLDWGVGEEDAKKVVSDLTTEKFINEQRFANAYCNDKFEFNSWGKQKIKANIYSHKLSSSAIENALDRIDSKKYESRLFELAERKWEKLERDEPNKRKKKTLSFLANKGYEADLIWKCLRKLDQQ